MQSYNVKLVAMVLVCSCWGWEHCLVKVAKLQYETGGHGPCLFWLGKVVGWEHSLVKVSNLQCKITGCGTGLFGWGFRNMVPVYSGWGSGEQCG